MRHFQEQSEHSVLQIDMNSFVFISIPLEVMFFFSTNSALFKQILFLISQISS